jgi:nitroreductase
MASWHLGASSCLKARRSAGEAIAAAFRAKYPDAKPEHIADERERLVRAPLVIAVVSRACPHVKIPEWEQVLSAGAAAMSLVLAAHALGYGPSWITEWYAYDRGVLDAFGLAPHERIAGFIHIGRPAGPPEDRPRPPLNEIAVRFTASLTRNRSIGFKVNVVPDRSGCAGEINVL